jgi:hypothetical protein
MKYQSHLARDHKKVRENLFVIIAILKGIPYMNALLFYVVTSVVVTMLLRFAQT